MKATPYILLVSLFFMFFSCKQEKGTQTLATKTIDTIVPSLDPQEKTRLLNQKILEARNTRDSLNLDVFLKAAVKIAEQYSTLPIYKKEYIETMDDSSFQVQVSIVSDFHFTKTSPHIIIRRKTPGANYIDIYSKEEKILRKVLSHEEWNMTYVNDTIQDINGDGLNDFVVNWYGSNGCCLKAFSNVYLIRADKKTFSNDLEFINPTFSPNEKIIRGVCYGHPGETEIYKFKWNGELVDTLEYISFEKNTEGEKTGKIIISNTEPYGKGYKILRQLNTIPKEYENIMGYDWFTGEGYD